MWLVFRSHLVDHLCIVYIAYLIFTGGRQEDTNEYSMWLVFMSQLVDSIASIYHIYVNVYITEYLPVVVRREQKGSSMRLMLLSQQ